MTTPLGRRGIAAGLLLAAFALGLGLGGCSSGSAGPTAGAPSDATTPAPSEEASGGAAAGRGELYGCTEGMMAYFAEYGYPAAEALDPATFEIPGVSLATAPDCYIVDEVSGAVRYGATWSDDPNGVLVQLGEALTAAGYVQSEDYGPLLWWRNGDDPITAEQSVAAAPQPIDGVEALWATW